MNIKPKKCKSVNSKTRGHGCGRLTDFRRFGLCNDCYVEWLLKTEEGQEYLDKCSIKAKKKVEKLNKAKDKKAKEEITDYKAKLQTKVNEIVRLIDYGQPCLATLTHSRQIHAGHVMSRGSQPTCKFNLHNIHRQSARSNRWQSDDIKMREGLEREYGKEYLEFVLSLKSIHALKYTRYQYQAFYNIACSIVNRIRREGLVFNSVEDRLKARNKYNIELGIYHLKHSKYER